MRILMCNSFYYLRGGAERCFFELSELLSSHGHEVIPFCMEDKRNQESAFSSYFISHIDFPDYLQRETNLRTKLRIAARVIYCHEASRNISWLIRVTKPDIAHVHGIAHEMSPSILPAIKRAGIPIVQTLHDYKLLCPNTSFISRGRICEACRGNHYFNVIRRRCKRNSWQASLLACVEMYVHKLSRIYEGNIKLFIAPSKFLQNKLIDYGITTPVVHLPNFVDVTGIQPCYESQNYFIYFGRLVALKGVGTLLQAMQLVKSGHLYIAGQGELDDSLRHYAQRNNITNVTFLGHLAKQDLIPLLQNAAFTVVPSEWYENCPMSVLESFACGTPVIGADIGGIPELIKEGDTGLLFAPGNVLQLAEKIQYLLDHPQQSVLMGRNGRRQVETSNDPETHYQQIVQIYQRLQNADRID